VRLGAPVAEHSAANEAVAAAAAVSGAASHYEDVVRLGAPVSQQEAANESVAAAAASSGAEARNGDSVCLWATVPEQSAAHEAADAALRRTLRHKRSDKHNRVKCAHTGQMDDAPVEVGAAGAATIDAVVDAEGVNDVAARGAEVRAADWKESAEEASAAVVSYVVGASSVHAGSLAALHVSESDTDGGPDGGSFWRGRRHHQNVFRCHHPSSGCTHPSRA